MNTEDMLRYIADDENSCNDGECFRQCLYCPLLIPMYGRYSACLKPKNKEMAREMLKKILIDKAIDKEFEK